jgi:glycosyltransferase involved in cell wall biosynthesis
MKISVVIPAYNEEATITKVIIDARKYFEGIDHEIIVINDKSTDKTGELALKYATTVINNENNEGHGASLLKGFRKATGEYILYIDADDQIKFEYFNWGNGKQLYEYMVNSRFDAIFGYRVGRHDKFFRKLVSLILKLTILLRHNYLIEDANCPFKIFKQLSLKYLLDKLPINPYIPTIDLAILAKKEDMRVVELAQLHFAPTVTKTGFLQGLNKKSLKLFFNAFIEVIKL